MLIEPHEAQTALWKKLREHYEQQLERYRAMNDQDLSLEKTAKLRGRIAEIKGFLELDRPVPSLASDAGDEPPSEW